MPVKQRRKKRGKRDKALAEKAQGPRLKRLDIDPAVHELLRMMADVDKRSPRLEAEVIIEAEFHRRAKEQNSDNQMAPATDQGRAE